MTTLDQVMLAQATQLQALTATNTQDFLVAFGIENIRRGRKMLDALCWFPARRFAKQMVHYDNLVGESGLHIASQKILANYVRHLEIEGQDNLPLEGPLLVLSNHPGMTDTLVLFASLRRPNLRIVAAQRPFLEALPNLTRQLIFVPEEDGQRMGVVRSVVSHLRIGGAILTFPAGQIEPDPISMPGAVESLVSWSESIAIFSRLVPEVKIVVAIVSGVLWSSVAQSPLTRLRRQQVDRERLGAALQALVQLTLPFYKPVTTRVAFSQAFTPADISRSDGSISITAGIKDRARQLIEYSQKKHRSEDKRWKRPKLK